MGIGVLGEDSQQIGMMNDWICDALHRTIFFVGGAYNYQLVPTAMYSY